MKIENLFPTPIWIENKSEFVKSTNIASEKYLKEAKKRNKDHIKIHGDFGISHHSNSFNSDNNFLDLTKYIGKKSWDFLHWQGFDVEQYQTFFTEFWVQEFSKKGGGHHSAHIHWNQHVSGFYFLKCSDKTSYPIFHEPRPSARATKLHLRKDAGICHGQDNVHYKPKVGDLVIFPGYLQHEFAVDYGKEPFRFIHWNIQAVPKGMAKDV